MASELAKLDTASQSHVSGITGKLSTGPTVVDQAVDAFPLFDSLLDDSFFEIARLIRREHEAVAHRSHFANCSNTSTLNSPASFLRSDLEQV